MAFYDYSTMQLLASTLCLIALEVLGTYLLGYWAKNGGGMFLFAGTFLFSLLGLTLGVSIRWISHMSVVNALWQSSTVVLITLLSYTCFGEVVTVRQSIGVVLNLLASLCFLTSEIQSPQLEDAIALRRLLQT
jgi:multidrug transporter EmrE-like cation transporter